MLAEAVAGDVALVFGREASGLTREQVDLCQRIVHIPANPDYSSLQPRRRGADHDLRTAHGGGSGHTARTGSMRTRVSFEEVDAFYLHLEEVMRATGFLDSRKPRRLPQRMRRLFTRARLEKEEVSLLRGLLKARCRSKWADRSANRPTAEHGPAVVD